MNSVNPSTKPRNAAWNIFMERFYHIHSPPTKGVKYEHEQAIFSFYFLHFWDDRHEQRERGRRAQDDRVLGRQLDRGLWTQRAGKLSVADSGEDRRGGLALARGQRGHFRRHDAGRIGTIALDF